MTITTEDGNSQNMFAVEPKMYITEIRHDTTRRTKLMLERAEILNGRLAMLGFVVAVGTYLTTGQIIPGLW
jgi:hypothetical protein